MMASEMALAISASPFRDARSSTGTTRPRSGLSIPPAVPVQADARPIGAYQATLFDAEQTGAFAPGTTIVAQGQHGRTLTSHRRPDLPRVCGCSGASTPSSRPAGTLRTACGAPHSADPRCSRFPARKLGRAFGFRSFFLRAER
jgi:hypothetical protein